jgi:aldehyde dehydrogenase (NAD+)
MPTQGLFETLGLAGNPRIVKPGAAGSVTSENPATGEAIAGVLLDDAAGYDRVAGAAAAAFLRWREIPAPERGLVVRAIGEEFRRLKKPLGELVSLEVGKIRSEGEGEIQEAIDIADYAVGLSRTLSGPVLQSERAHHRMYEQWLPLGPVGVITAFNFPAAVWAWNAMIAAVCGDPILWKPSLLAPLTAIACNSIADRVATSLGHPGVFSLVIGADDVVGEAMIADKRLPLISATGSTRMGRHVNTVVAGRLGRTLLELGGNNAVILTPSADLELALRAVTFSAVGTAGQRCTTTRRLIVHESHAAGFVERLARAYRSVRIGDPLADGTLVGPLINARAVEGFQHAVARARAEGGTVVVGGGRPVGLSSALARGHFVEPTIIEAPAGGVLPIASQETFAPILYVFRYRTLEEAIALQNSVDQGLSSAIFTDSVRESERFLAVSGAGSDCGLAYVNLGTSGAEIGGAFGGEKETGGGRESGSDSWKNYMRRQNVVVNASGEFRLAQGVQFG